MTVSHVSHDIPGDDVDEQWFQAVALIRMKWERQSGEDILY
jgi:hypothetical protein